MFFSTTAKLETIQKSNTTREFNYFLTDANFAMKYELIQDIEQSAYCHPICDV